MVGTALLLAAIGLALAAAGAAARPTARWADPRIGTWLLSGSVLGLWGAVGHLALVINRMDTSYAYVAEQTRSGMGRAIRFSALWSGAEGSLLLFAAICATALLVGHRNGPGWQRTGVALTVAGLALASKVGADPFQRLDLPPLSGGGMAPILEHYAMVIHPPLLYTGLALALVPALIRRPQTAHRWGLAGLAVLTVALGFGSAWAYVELGWGGWWAWDPIENVALIVWLLLAAGLHWRPLDPEGHTGHGMTNAVMAWALCWPAVIGGAALTRTSLRTSVHAFADAAGLAVWLWPLAILASVGAGLRMVEGRSDRSVPPATGARLRVVALPSLVLVTAALIVAAGTYRPFIGGDGTAGWFYSRSMYPLAAVGAVLIGLVPTWPTAGRTALLGGAGGAAALTAAVAIAGWTGPTQLLSAATIGFGVATVLLSGRRRLARTAGHLGVLLVLFGALAGTASTESVVRLRAGEAADVDGHRVELVTTRIIDEDPLRAEAVLLVDDTYRLAPSVSVFPERNLRLPEVSTRTRPWLDSQAVLRDVDAQAGALVTVLFRPWNQLVWWGLALLALAAVVAATASGPKRRQTPAKGQGPSLVTGSKRKRVSPTRRGF